MNNVDTVSQVIIVGQRNIICNTIMIIMNMYETSQSHVCTVSIAFKMLAIVNDETY